MSASSAMNAATVDGLWPAASESADGPTVLAYRRPDDRVPEYAADGYQQYDRDALPPVVLQLPDLDEPLPLPETTEWVRKLEPLVSRVLMAAIAVLGLVLLVLMWRGVGSTSVTAVTGHDSSPLPRTKAAPHSPSQSTSTTPIGPFRVPMVEASKPAPPAQQAAAPWPAQPAATPVIEQNRPAVSEHSNVPVQSAVPVQSDVPVHSDVPQYSDIPQRNDVPPDMPKYAPSAPRTEGPGPELGPAASYDPRPPERVADRRAWNDNSSAAPGHQPGVARFRDTIDKPNLEPSYDGPRSRLR